MVYADRNFKTKKALKAAIVAGESIGVFSPGLYAAQADGIVYLEGPHSPQAHTWYATATVVGGIIKGVK
jgi:hypothetical protein